LSLRRAFIIALLAILGLYLTACLFVHPIADDFIFASDARAGLWTAWLAEYRGWAGRYASNALVLSAPTSLSPGVYRAAAAVMILGLVGAAYAFVRAVSGDKLTRQEAWGASLVFSTLYLSQMPSLGESVYWFTAAATHYAPLVLVLVHLALVITYLRTDGRGTANRIRLVLALALLVAVDGFNEVMTLMLLAFYAIWAIWSIGDTSRKPSARRLPRVLLVLTVLCAGVMLMSPGNTVRRTLYAAVHHRIGLSLGMTALQTIRFSIEWLSGGALLLATVLFVPLAAKWAAAWPKEPRRAAQIMWLSIAGLMLVIPAAVFPAYWETGMLGQHRTVNSAYFAFLVLWFVAVAMWLVSGSRHARAIEEISHVLRVPLAVLLLAALAFTHNSYALGVDVMSGRLSGFERALASRHAELQACHDRAERACRVSPILTRPASFFFLDVSEDPTDWVNASYARYFDLDEVRLDRSR